MFVKTSHGKVHRIAPNGLFPCGIRLTVEPTPLGNEIVTDRSWGGSVVDGDDPYYYSYVCHKCIAALQPVSEHECPNCKCGYRWRAPKK